MALATAVMGFVAGISVDQQAVEPEPAPTVTVTKTVETTREVAYLPASCEQALRKMQKWFDDAVTVASYDGEQLGIMSLAYQAIYKKDWKTLNDLAERQRKMSNTLTEETAAILPEIPDIEKDVAKCQREKG